MALARHANADAQAAENALYELPRFGNVSFLHMTDCHAQLRPIYFREPSVNIGVASMSGKLPHLVGEQLRVTVGHVQERDVAEPRQFVERVLGRLRVGVCMTAERHAGDRRCAQNLQKLAAIEAHGPSPQPSPRATKWPLRGLWRGRTPVPSPSGRGLG